MILGVLGGSGLYELEGLEDVREHAVSTPFGAPSAPVVGGRLGAAEVLFLPRHGRGHRFLPSEINYRANVHALKQLGAERVLSISVSARNETICENLAKERCPSSHSRDGIVMKG